MMSGLVGHHPRNACDRKTTMPGKTAVETDLLPAIQYEGLRIARRRRPQDVETDFGETHGESPDDPFDSGAMSKIQ